MCWRPRSLNVIVLLYGAMVLVAFLLVMSSTACIVPPIILCVSAVLVAISRRVTTSLMACLVFFLPYLLLTMFPLGQHNIITAIGNSVYLGHTFAHVCISAFVPVTTILVCLGWLLFSRRAGIVVAALAGVMAMLAPVALSLWCVVKEVDLIALGEATVLLRYLLRFANVAGIIALLGCEFSNHKVRILSTPWMGIVFAVCYGCLTGWQVWMDFGSTNHRSDCEIVLWWPESVDDQPDYARANVSVGLDNIGLFGELPKLLAHEGFCVTMSDRLDARRTLQCGCLVHVRPIPLAESCRH